MSCLLCSSRWGKWFYCACNVQGRVTPSLLNNPAMAGLGNVQQPGGVQNNLQVSSREDHSSAYWCHSLFSAHHSVAIR